MLFLKTESHLLNFLVTSKRVHPSLPGGSFNSNTSAVVSLTSSFQTASSLLASRDPNKLVSKILDNPSYITGGSLRAGHRAN